MKKKKKNIEKNTFHELKGIVQVVIFDECIRQEQKTYKIIILIQRKCIHIDVENRISLKYAIKEKREEMSLK